MKFSAKILTRASLVGFLLAVTSHLIFISKVDSLNLVILWWLPIGIFLVAIPGIIILGGLTKNVPRSKLWQVALRGCSNGEMLALGTLIIYAAMFLVFMDKSSGSPKPNLFRGGTLDQLGSFSTVWSIFYFVFYLVGKSYQELNK